MARTDQCIAPKFRRRCAGMIGASDNTTPLIAAAIIYFMMFWPFVRMVSRLQATRTAG